MYNTKNQQNQITRDDCRSESKPAVAKTEAAGLAPEGKEGRSSDLSINRIERAAGQPFGTSAAGTAAEAKSRVRTLRDGSVIPSTAVFGVNAVSK